MRIINAVLCWLIQQCGVRCGQVCQNARYLYGLQQVAGLVQGGSLGRPVAGQMIKTMHRASVHNSGEDDHAYLWEHGVHDFDSAVALFGRPKRIFCDSYNPPYSPCAYYIPGRVCFSLYARLACMLGLSVCTLIAV